MKRMYALITILVVFLGFAFFQEKNANPTNSANGAKEPTLGILQLMTHPSLDAIHDGIIKGLNDSGFHPGKNIKIDYQNAQNDQSNLKTMSTKFANENATASIGITTPSAQALASTIHNNPVILGAITDPVGAGLVKNLKHPGGHITGVANGSPLQKQLNVIKAFMPKLKTLGIIYTSSDPSSTAQAKQFAQLCKKEGIKLKTYTIANSNDLNQVSSQMVTQVQAVYVPNDNTIAAAMDTLVNNANKQNIPVFPSVDFMVKSGGIATYGVDQFQMGVTIGKMTAKILRGENPATTPVKRFQQGKMIVNVKQAKKLHMQIPASIMKEAETKGEVIK
ncbi:ABC transporter substrate-binding protein [Nicoliella spurrieriana]|uniref:ABC transporter substrate-binding protein n=1 Tax=Nicoliella spurrieriana TaxID=2925830 RepID=A0A976X4Z5_9LACO|nr:tryptophan ABC transporter substrate-binding protein [Nicoliella spurrieriana]UQS86295.1 ABC transporter substrate-binding protein [Nicoliella spurrieriana]